MNDTLDTDIFDPGLAEANPVTVHSAEVLNALAALGKDITNTPRLITTSRRSPRRRRMFAGIAAVAVLGAGAGVAAAEGLFAHTGEQATGGEQGTGELIRIDAPDASDVLAQLGADIALPPGVSLDQFDAQLLAKEPTIEAESGLRSGLQFHAACAWTTYWLTSVAAGDTAAGATALAVLDNVPRWDALVASDGGGVIDMWRNIAAAAHANDASLVHSSGYDVNCTEPTAAESVAPG